MSKRENGLTHFDARGQARMVDVATKAETHRIAIARGRIAMLPATLKQIRSGSAKKGDVLGVARLAAIQAAKRTSDLIPLCHPLALTRIDVAFVGSCTNARLSDLREAARIVRGQHVARHVKALVVPGSQAVRAAAEREGLDRVFTDAGFDWRGAGCSMCLAMNQDRLNGSEVCASSSNRNFKGRQGSPTGRTLLMSPAMVAAAAVAGEVVDVRDMHVLEAVGGH